MTIKGGKKEISENATILLLTLICKCMILWIPKCECLRNLTGFVWWMVKFGK